MLHACTQGYEATRVGGSHDGGVDVHLRRHAAGAAEEVYVQCKSRAKRNVGVDEYRGFVDQMARARRALAGSSPTTPVRGILLTNQALTQAASTLHRTSGDVRRIEVCDADALMARLAPHAATLRVRAPVVALLEVGVHASPLDARKHRLPWSEAEEMVLTDAFRALGLGAMERRPWKAVLQEIHKQNPGVLSEQRSAQCLKDKARVLGLVPC